MRLKLPQVTVVTVSEAMQLSKKGLKVELVGSSSQATGGALRCQASAGGIGAGVWGYNHTRGIFK